MPGRRYAILGTGALGGYYGAKLHHAGCEVHFLLRSDYEHIAARGLTVESPDGDLSIPAPHIHRRPEDLPEVDFALVCLKTTANDALPDLLPPAVGERTTVVMMQNGLGVEEQAARLVGPDRVMGGMAFLCSHKVGPGHIRHMDYGSVRLGDYDDAGRARGLTDRMRAFAEDLQRAGITVELEADLLLARWKKLVWNVPFNGLTVVLDATTDQLTGEPGPRALCQSLMREVAADAAAFDRTIDEPFIQRMMDNTDRMVSYRPSMKVDYDQGRPMEVEAIYGHPVRAAESRGVATPQLRMLYEQLSFLDARRRAAAATDTGVASQASSLK